MQVVVDLNQGQADIDPSGGYVWTCNYDTPQKFTITVTAGANEAGQVVGLTQTLVTSTRVATYGADADGTPIQMSIAPQNLPCLDGDEERVPWYNNQCEGVQLPAAPDSVTLTLEDSPSTNVPSLAQKAQNRSNITRLAVAETFLVTLYNHTTAAPVQQWTWSYSYTLTPNADGNLYHKPAAVHAEAQMAAENPMQPIVIVEPVATASTAETWTPDGWGRP